MKPLLLSLFLVALALPAKALSPEAENWMRANGFDPSSADVQTAIAAGEVQSTYMDEPVVFSVESLAAAKKKNQLTNFIATRVFVAKLKQNFAGTPLPSKNYEALYLTPEERQLVGRKVAQSLLGGGNSKPA